MKLIFDRIELKNKKMIALPVIFGLLLVLAAGCGSDDNDSDDNNQLSSQSGVNFEGVEVPTTDEAKRIVQASPTITIDGTPYPIGYETLLRSGDVLGAETFGLIMDQNGSPVVNIDGSRFISSDNDFSSLIQKNNRLFMITHFESRPGAMYLTELNQDTASGAMTPVSTRSIDFSQWGGLWVPCAGSVTHWNTHLGSEEYPPDARLVEEAQTPDDFAEYNKPMLRYFGVVDPFAPEVTIEQIHETFYSYLYGYPVEVNLDDEGTPTVNKRYAMGRVAVELAYVMPDSKTVYISDDGTNVGFFMFIADTAGDLSAGTLYAAGWNQTGSENGGSADIEWISLGHATQTDVQTLIDNRTSFSDIFTTAEPNADNTCPDGFTPINTNSDDGVGQECLQLQTGMELAASRLETRRYAAMLGATTEFRKEEGITFNPDTNKLYVSMSEVTRGMEDFKKSGEDDNTFDIGGYNDIKLPYNDCGCVYSLDVAANADIGSDYVVQNMTGELCGTMTTYAQDSPYANNTCDVDNIANPDNLTFITGKGILIIGEDTGSGHQNDAVWAYHLDDKSLTRIETTPYGSETTSPYYYPNINGWAYIMSVVQHPYGESDEDKLVDTSDAAAYVGYIGPIPAMD